MSELVTLGNLRGPRGLSGDTIMQVETGLEWGGVVDLSAFTESAVLHATLSGDITGWTLPAPDGSRSWTIELNLSQPTDTPHAAAWAGLTAAYGVPPTLTATAGALDQVFLECDGVRWWVKAGALSGQALS